MENITKVSDFNSVRLRLASPDAIMNWSHGEITKPETINYRTQRYEKDGLFCEKIFGPSKDWECYCGKYKRIRYKGIVCDKCGVEVTRSIVRRERMGHIKLAVPVSHIWFLRGVPSKIGSALGLGVQDLEKVIYFSAYIIKEVNEEVRDRVVDQLEQEYKMKQKEIKGGKTENERSAETMLDELREQYKGVKDDLKNLKPMQILSELEYFNLSSRFGQVFSAGIGAEAVRAVLESMDIEKMIKHVKKELENEDTADKKKLFKRMKLFQGFKKAGLKLEWMLPTAIPVIPPDLRPMVALDGGRFATSDLNDLYRRIINRNNRLKKLIDLGAPEVITRNEKRMLQEAVDALFDNSARKGQSSVAASTGQRRPLRSLADALKGKQGRFRQNLLGKRVDYSGRSVIVVGPQLKLHQAGLPKKMALELFKPFIINKLIEKEFAHNVRTAGRMVDAEAEEAYEILDEIIEHHYVLLNRAPTLHRLSIQAFQPVLIEGKAIQVHPMVCAAFNADFDGDQMAVHVPLTDQARDESANIMLSSKNLLKPASGEPIAVPSKDIVLGIYFITHIKAGVKGEGKIFATEEEALLAYQLGYIAVNAKIKVDVEGTILETSAGRIMLNDILPVELRFINEEMTQKEIKQLVAKMLRMKGQEETAAFIDRIKSLGFKMAGRSGISWGMDDLKQSPVKKEAMIKAEAEVSTINQQYAMGLLTEEERKNRVIEIWNRTKNLIADAVKASLDKEGTVYTLVHSKARGSESVVVQMMGMKGLVAGPTGETIELPVKSSFKEGFNVLEYFISTHGARKGMADTALRTATAGYLTRRLVDVSQDIIVREEDCGDTEGAFIYRADSDRIGQSFAVRVEGRYLAEDVIDPATKKVIIKKGVLATKEDGQVVEAAGISEVKIRNVVTCKSKRGICRHCYGIDLGRSNLVAIGQAVGIVAAQAIGEPGTQLTMRTFHTGGVAGGSDITQGLPRVEEIFECRPPKGEAMISEVDGKIIDVISESKKTVTVKIETTEGEVVEYQVPAESTLVVSKGQLIGKGTQFNEGHIDLKKLFETMGQEAIQRYVIQEIQEIYAAQGEAISDKHVEVIIRQMLSRVKVISAGDTDLLPGDIVEKDQFEESNNEAIAAKEEIAVGEQLIMGITKVALSTESFLSAASFQETARVLINAAVTGKDDRLRGLKENVIIGRLIPAGTGYRK
ncbi:MAG: DNA-directed RNA polymerase subunit beta' [Candidatus Moranbacteria bacterium GW2011_GWC2_37_73]|nr:MAG: DNA-directed RNA polymerase subunit beta' [Parcubacteria group bacterium GW2011_GWC1_36_108]KKQ00423.1 MAG: DNA-directed RNA polymerase subunit beta' [Candidatus Moranbacteria bacterium GW2011_GWD1_36_198]KKQ01621.1 MAG: DNA-directed RNA polymerase subunit beta' [Candidatus Moranbacteria bacterium GW2011_GWD2_36_198]KKQ40359.1 MAG: DNA-directed RNA polymerase subunit beta' [Candidatus Moranbacteria bacterium GW2011_GWC2_37_73]HBI50859.1 DNA-directed RNA polymerase subunit beta' [Candida